MGKFKIGIDVDKKFLKKLTQEHNSGVVVQNAKHHLALHPIHLNNFNKSIKDTLNAGIAKYNKSLDGILLGYENIKLLSNMGTICNDSPYIHYDLLVNFFVFKPEIGKEMRGVVNRKSTDHVGILVYHTFNVSIPKPQDEDDWLGESVTMGYEVIFRISFIDFSLYLPHIKGELVSIVSKTNNETNSNKINIVKNKKIIFDDFEEEPESKTTIIDPAMEQDISEKKLKKKKKYQADDIDANSFDEVTPKKSKKSKKRKLDSDTECNEKPKKSKKNKNVETNEILFEKEFGSTESNTKDKKKHKKKKKEVE